MEKGTQVGQSLRAVQHLRANRIRACFFIQFGYPGETWRDVQETVRLVRETRPDDIGVSVSYPLPGTKFYDRVRERLGAQTNWIDSEDLAMMFRGAYKTEFYRALHDALHAEVKSWNSEGDSASDQSLIDQLWREVERLERTCRNQDATELAAVVG
jgi:radical SAM superfamily enzyme YgiQ (UPF0313 family)